MKIKYVIFSALGMLALNAGAADNVLQIKNLSIVAGAPTDMNKEGVAFVYSPSIMLHADGSADAWMGGPGFEWTSQSVSLGKGSSTPYQLGNGSCTGLSVETTKDFYSVSFRCPGWATNTQGLTIAVYKWDTDFDTTTDGDPYYSKRFDPFNDNASLTITNGEAAEKDKTIKFPAGKYVFMLCDGTARDGAQAGVWTFSELGDDQDVKVQRYDNYFPVDGSLDAKLAYEADDIRSGSCYNTIYHQSSANGKDWAAPTQVMIGDYGAGDQVFCHEPSLVKAGEYYYAVYLGAVIEHYNLCIARSKNADGPWEKWNGTGWGGKAKDLRIGGYVAKYPSVLIKDNTVYIYAFGYEDSEDEGNFRLVTAPLGENWPAQLEDQGEIASVKEGGVNQKFIVKYCDDINEFIGTVSKALGDDKYECNVWESADGKNFTKVGVMPGLAEGANDVQFSGDELGHINVNKQQYLGYYHGAFAGWSAALAPLTITGQSGVSKVNTASALVYATKGAINVTEGVEVQVYSAAGAYVGATNGTIAVPAGVYVVRMGDKTFKVLVK